MIKGTTLAFQGEERVEGKYGNANLLRYTVNACVTGTGEKLPISCIFRWTKTREAEPRWSTQNPEKPCKCFFTKGGSQSEKSMIAWIKEIFLPYCESKNRGPTEWALLIMDPATSHHTPAVKEFCKQNRIQIAMMPASTTYLFQMIDVVVGKKFKDEMCEQWALWMLKNNLTTRAGNWKRPTQMDCLDWVVKAWEEIGSAGIRKKAKELGMCPEPGPEIEGYVDKAFVNQAPDEEEGDVYIAELERDFEAENE